MTELVSTRGSASESVHYVDALLQGRAPDGGLYVPLEYPQVSTDELRGLAGQPYEAIFNFVKGKLVGDDIPAAEQARIAREAYAPEKFPDAVGGNIVPVRQIDDNLLVENLSLGPTAAFKDTALQSLALDMRYALKLRDECRTIVGVTSGDTGSATEFAFKGLGRMSLFMMSSAAGMSPFQKAQMAELSGGNIHNLSIPADFDKINDLLDQLKSDPEFADIAAVNSINWGRVVAQVPYYFAGYLQAVGDRIGQEVDFVVPTGNVGNALAAHVARRMGLPIRRVVIANNENHNLAELIQTGDYVVEQGRDAERTNTPSMDIRQPKNLERLIHELFEGDGDKVRDYMQRFKETGRVALSDYGLPPTALRDLGFDGDHSDRRQRLATIRSVYQRSGDIIDPHTAAAVAVAYGRPREVPTICLETALPVKFENTMREALGFVPARPERFRHIGTGPNRNGFVPLAHDLAAVAAYIRQYRGPRQAVLAR